MFPLRTIEWFGQIGMAQNINAASEATGAWLRLVYELSGTDPLRKKRCLSTLELLRLARPDLLPEGRGRRAMPEGQAQRALIGLLDLHIQSLELPRVIVAEPDIWDPSEEHWVAMFQSRTLSHPLTCLAIKAKCADRLCIPQRTTSIARLRVPRSVEIGGEEVKGWDIGLWLGVGFGAFMSRALSSPANTIALEDLL